MGGTFPSGRFVTTEILDSLDGSHPEARRSRRDLDMLDIFLGGTRWITRSALESRESALEGVIELGAGEGRLCNSLSARLDGCPVTGLDLQARPAMLNPAVRWTAGNCFESLPGLRGGIVVGNLILHHFESGDLRSLGEMFSGFRILLFSEPFRHPWSLGLCRMAFPFVGRVTRYDMPASIRAGFRRGEISRLLGLEGSCWRVSESFGTRGVLRFKAWRS